MNFIEMLRLKEVIKRNEKVLQKIKETKAEYESERGKMTELTFARDEQDDVALIRLYFGDKIRFFTILFDHRTSKVEIIEDTHKVTGFDIPKEDQNILYIFISGELLKEFANLVVGE